MKKVNITIKREQTFEIQIDDSKIDSEVIKSWSEHMWDLTEQPESLYGYCERQCEDSDFPYVNLAQSIAYAIFVNESDYIECLRFQNITPNELFTPSRDLDYPIHYICVDSADTEYEFNSCETI